MGCPLIIYDFQDLVKWSKCSFTKYSRTNLWILLVVLLNLYLYYNECYVYIFRYTVGAIIVNLFITSLLIFIIIDFVLFLILYSFVYICIYWHIYWFWKFCFFPVTQRTVKYIFYWKNFFFCLTFYLLYKKTRKEPLNKFLLLW